MRLGVLASGRGSNLQAIIDAIAAGRLPATIVGVFSDKPKAGALEKAREAGIPAHAMKPAEFATRLAYDQALFSQIDEVRPDLIVCAGYMRLINEMQVTPRLGRIINIHPSLLPAFKGLHTHQQALDAGAPEHGASVHFVSAELDGGPVIAQARVPVLPGDTAATLARRVLVREHPLLIATLRLLIDRRVGLSGGHVTFDADDIHVPLQLDQDNALHSVAY